ncbi:MAG: thiamine pyrophosphate-binding protein [Alphaproteobacteria bacterium]|nr:thiamine pyrophosphate-binding protein [Alphaproteobacteria bacterium]
MRRTGARHIVDALVAHGVDRVFCVPGESYLPVLDALHDVSDKIQLIACRMEAGAANMAEAHGKLTGRPGVCMVTRGPGATHASVGVHTAQQDSTPMLLFIGQVSTADKGREAFQEVDYEAFFGPLAKWAVELEDASRVREIVDRAFATALQGRMGPVALALPEDMLAAEAESDFAAPRAVSSQGLDPGTLADIGALLSAAKRPLLVLGGSGWDAASLAAIRTFSEQNDLPVVLSFRRKDLLDNDSPQFVGDLGLGPNPKLLARIRECDLILAVGARLGENPTQGYTLFTRAETAKKLVHIHAGAEEIGRVWPARVGAVADVRAAAAALSGVRVRGEWGVWRAAARSDYEAWTAPIAVTGAVNMSEVVVHMCSVLPHDAIITNGAGNYAAWLHRFIRHRSFRTQLAPTSGAMGYGVPAAIAAKLAHPDREVVAFAGDGCFLMTGQELATAVQYNVNVVIVVVDNGSYGTIRLHQERHFPGRVSATDLRNPDFAAYARAFGAWAATVESTEGFAQAFAEARKAGRPALLHVKTDIEDISPGRTIAGLRAGS